MIRPFGTLLLILIISLSLTAQDEKASPKFILGGSIFGNEETSVRSFGSLFGSPEDLVLTTKNTQFGFQPYILFGAHPKRKFGLALRSAYDKGSSSSNLPNIIGMSNESLLQLGLDLLYRKTLLKKNNLSLFGQASVGSDLFAIAKNRSINDSRTFNIQSEIEFGATFQIAKSWNLLLILPVIDFRFQSRDLNFSNITANIISIDNNSRVFNLNTSFTNLNLGIEKTF